MGKAAVYRLKPFTIILKREVNNPVIAERTEVKFDPGSKISGIAVVAQGSVIFAMELHHRGQRIKGALYRRAALRRGRRNRKTRYRAPRFNNRARPKGWLPPSLQSRVDNCVSWMRKLMRFVPVTECHVETVRFDTQRLENPEISGIEYQQGTLMGYEIRGYLLEKWGRKCAYCDEKGVPLEVEHVVPPPRGSNRVSNLTLACRSCNEKKGNKSIEEFLKRKPDRLQRIKSQLRKPLKDVAAVNATRNAIYGALKSFGVPTSMWSSGRTKLNRVRQGYEKSHWIDAACVGESGAQVSIAGVKPLEIRAMGRGCRQVRMTDKYGFPRGKAGRVKRVFGFSTGDRARLALPKGKYAGTWEGAIAGIRERGYHDIRCGRLKIKARHCNFKLLQRADGYAYA